MFIGDTIKYGHYALNRDFDVCDDFGGFVITNKKFLKEMGNVFKTVLMAVIKHIGSG